MQKTKSSAPILVLGATGTVGQHVVRFLIEKDKDIIVRAATRNVSNDMFNSLGDRVQLVFADYMNKESLLNAMKGVEQTFFAQTQGEDTENEAKHVVDCMAEAGIKHVVKLSSFSVNSLIGIENTAIEKYIQDKGIIVTSLRPTAFMSNALDWAGAVRSQNKFFSTLTEKGVYDLIDNRDIAEVAVASLLNTNIRGQELIITGESMGAVQIASTFSEVSGRTISVQLIDKAALTSVLQSRGMQGRLLEKVVDVIWYNRDGALDFTSDVVKKLTGHKPRTFKDFVIENRAHFI